MRAERPTTEEYKRVADERVKQSDHTHPCTERYVWSNRYQITRTTLSNPVAPADDVGVVVVQLAEAQWLHLVLFVLEHVPHVDGECVDLKLPPETVLILGPTRNRK